MTWDMSGLDAGAGAAGKGPLAFAGPSPWHVAKATWKEASKDNLGLIASGVAFMIFLAFVPLLVAVVLTYGLVATPEQVADDIAVLSRSMPEAAASIISGQLRNIVALARSTAGFGLLIALLVSVYGAMKAASGLITALNIVFGIQETRSMPRVTLLTLEITIGLVLAFVAASLGLSVINFLASLLPDLGGAAGLLLQLSYWLVTALAISLIIAAIYHLAPDRPRRRWRWITPGSVMATVVWLLATFAFSYYVRKFGNYNATYGSLAAIVIFLTWLHLTSYIVLIGAELNYVLERRR